MDNKVNMYIQQIYTKCLAEAAYYVESNGEAAIIDPLRDIDTYIDIAEQRNTTIKYVFETHFHADFVSGHVDLMNATGAEIVYGPTAQADYEITVAEDDQLFSLGDIQIKVLHTPGHTLESSCFLVLDQDGKEHSIFTGDTLFVGDVGRPDLAVSATTSREDLAEMLYTSIIEKLKPLDSNTIMYPGHGAGSQCGKSLSSETQSTLGAQLNSPCSLIANSQENFVSQVTSGLSSPPQYFPKNAHINKKGYNSSIHSIIKNSLTPISPELFNKELETSNTLIIDSRTPSVFSSGHISGALNVGLDGFFAVWIGTLVKDLNTRILLVSEKEQEEDTIVRLARVGYENVIGYLDGGMDAWVNTAFSSDNIDSCCPSKFKLVHESFNVLDVRTAVEFSEGHLSNAINIPLAELQNHIDELDSNKTYYVHCKSGYRSVIAISILKKAGIRNVINVKKGYDAITNDIGCCSNNQQIENKA